MARLDPQSLPQHVDRLYRAAWALCGSPHDAEDLVQETFARVLARPRFLHGQDELAYLMRVLRNTFLTQRRTAGRRPQNAQITLDDIEFADPRTGERPEQALQAQEVFGRSQPYPRTIASRWLLSMSSASPTVRPPARSAPARPPSPRAFFAAASGWRAR